MKCFIRKLKSRGFVISISAIIILVVISISPYLIGKNFIAEKLTANDWMSFYGGYFGAILGLVGVIISIFYSSREARIDRLNTINLANEERRHSKMPFMILEDISDISSRTIDMYPCLTVGQSSSTYFATSPRKISLKNIGTGPATDFMIVFEKTKVFKDNIEIYDFEGTFKTSVLDQEQNFEFCIITKGDSDSLQKVLSTETPYVFEISFEYKDMFGNKYNQQFKFAYRLALKGIYGERNYYKLVFLDNYFNNGKPIFLN